MDKNILLKNASVIDENGNRFKNLNMYIVSGKIDKISTDLYEENFRIIDCTDYYVTPTFVNLHAHSPMNILKGIAEDVTISDWFNKKIFPYESKLTQE